MTEVSDICQPKFFTLDQANKLVPLFKRITEKSEQTCIELLSRQRYLIKTHAPDSTIKECDTKVGNALVQWGTKMAKLGTIVFIDGFIGLDSGTFFWSWHLGDEEIKYYHNYSESPSMRRPLSLIQGLL